MPSDKKNLRLRKPAPTLKELEAFLCIVRLGGFRVAAERLKTTQAAISARIRGIEGKLGLALFDRRTRAAKLTARGRELVPYAERMIGLSNELSNRFGSARQLRGIVRLGATGAVAGSLLPKLMHQLRQQHPAIEIEFCIDLTANLTPALRSAALDVVIMAGSAPDAGFAAEQVGSVPLSWVAARELGLPRRVVTPAELAAWPIVSDVPGTYIRGLVNEWFQKGGVQPQRHHGCSNVLTRLRLIRAALSVGTIPTSHVNLGANESPFQIVDVTPPLPMLQYILAYNPGPEPAVKAVVSLAKALLAEEPNFRFTGTL